MLRGLWVLAVLVVATLVCATAAILAELVASGRNLPVRIGRKWARVLLWALGLKPDYRGRIPSDEVLPCIFVANHLSVVDVWAMLAVAPLNARFVAKRSLFRIPVLGWSMSAAGFIPIDRAQGARSMIAVSRASEALRSGQAIVMFPEGTRSREGRLLPFKKGAFHLALSDEVPVVPVAISGSGRVVRPRSIAVRKAAVTVTFLEPIDVNPYLPADVEGLIAHVRGAIAERLEPDERPLAVPDAAGAAAPS
jgi:1-acyl-sn-glycerol-3-phosphate acyltransferase